MHLPLFLMHPHALMCGLHPPFTCMRTLPLPEPYSKPDVISPPSPEYIRTSLVARLPKHYNPSCIGVTWAMPVGPICYHTISLTQDNPIGGHTCPQFTSSCRITIWKP